MNQSEFRNEAECLGWFRMSWQRKRAHRRARVRAQIAPVDLGKNPARMQWPYCFLRGVDLANCLLDPEDTGKIVPESLYVIDDHGRVHADPWRIRSVDVSVSWSRIIQQPKAFFMDVAYCCPTDFGVDPVEFEFRFKM